MVSPGKKEIHKNTSAHLFNIRRSILLEVFSIRPVYLSSDLLLFTKSKNVI